MASRNGDGRHAPGGGGRGRGTTIVLVVLLALIAFGGGYLFASQLDRDAADPTPAASSTQSAQASTGPSTTPSAGPSTTPSPNADDPELEDGRHFVFTKNAAESPAALTFDLAEFYTGQEAVEVAESRGIDEVPNDYFIVNDNPRLRTLPVAGDATVRYIPEGTCCALEDGSLDAFLASVAETQQTDFPPKRFTPWWITVQDGQVVRIQQQYLP